jgi:hypothetical protein
MSVVEDLLAAYEPWLTPDATDYLSVIGEMFTEVELYSADDDEGEGWSLLFDPDRCPPQALPYLAQYVGEELPFGLPENMARERIKDRANQLRGTPWSIFAAAQRSLTGNRLVSLVERDGAGGGDDADRITVVTYADQTPDAAQVEADIRSVLDADLELNYVVATGQTWQSVRDDDGYTSWRDLRTANASWADLATQQAGSTAFSRPRP